VDRALDQALEHLQVGITALRGLITDLRPAALDELGTERCAPWPSA
jgi:signal transduction histidine kinase